MNKTVVVAVERRVSHARYSRVVRRTSKFYAHDERNACKPGDVVTIDPDGYVQITDRSKDVIKSGGEWISSIDLENAAMGHPAIAEAATV